MNNMVDQDTIGTVKCRITAITVSPTAEPTATMKPRCTPLF
jgi:hypothetical protein